MSTAFETALSDFKVEALFTPGPDVLRERYHLYVKPGLDTACWTWAPPHHIFLGDQALRHIKPSCSADEHVEYLKKYLWHEYAHACFTERDFARTQAELARIHAPFGVYNRFEDIRIEHLVRERWDGFRFAWTTYEELKPVTGSSARDADGILHLLTQLEGDATQARALATDAALFAEVLPFYQDACACRSGLELMAVIDRWLRRFPQAVEQKGPGAGAKDNLALSAELALTPGALGEFLADARADADPREEDTGQRDHLTPYDPDKDASREAQQGTVLGPHPTPVNDADVAEVTGLLGALYAKRPLKVSTATPAKRVSIRHHILGRGPYRRTEEQGRRPKKVGVVIDCSGSMSGLHIAQARVLALALSRLAVDRAVEGYVILSKVGSSGPAWERFKLPMSRGAVERIPANGLGEGLAPALLANKALATQTDLLLVYTDGEITDAPLDKRWLHSLGVFIYGVYVGRAPEAQARMKRYFDRVLIRHSVQELVRDLLLTL